MPTLHEFLDITEIVDDEIYDMKKHKCNFYLVIDVQYVVRFLRDVFAFDTMFPVTHFHVLLDL